MNKDLKNSALYVVNGIICDYKDYSGVYPSVAIVRDNFNFPKYADITDNEIQDIIDNVVKIDNK